MLTAYDQISCDFYSRLDDLSDYVAFMTLAHDLQAHIQGQPLKNVTLRHFHSNGLVTFATLWLPRQPIYQYEH